jgi:hypothetical protein
MVSKTSGVEEKVRTRITPYDCCSGLEVDETERAGAGTVWIGPGLIDGILGAGPSVHCSPDPPFAVGLVLP